MKKIYTSIDIGSDTIKIVVCELYKNKLNLLAATTEESFGIKKGLISDVELARDCVKKAINKIEKILGIKIDKVIANVPSYLAEFGIVSGEIKIESENNIVTGEVINEVIKKTLSNFSDPLREILTVVPIDFKVDDRITKDPKGEIGKKLSTRGVLITLPKKNIYSIISLLKSINIDVIDISIENIGDLYSLKMPVTENTAGVVVNIGSEITAISLFNKEIIIKNSIMQLGGKNIDNDIAYIYKITPKEAKQIKENFAMAHKNYANNSECFEIINKYGENVSISQSELSEIVYSRLEETLNLIKKEINALANREIDYIIVSGGTSNLPYFDSVIEMLLGKKAILGNVKIIGIRNNKYSSCVGNIMYFIQKLKLKGKGYTMVSQDEAELLSSPRKNNINETSIWKALIGFFDE